MKNRKEIVAIAIAAIMMFSVMTVIVPTTVAQQEDEEAINTLRVYGRCTEDAEFPYTDYQGPFSIQSDENPSKDFVVFNPAFMYHGDPNAHDLFGRYFMSAIKADGDASEKVHLKMWYVPKLVEPVGETYPDLDPEDKVSNWDDIGMGDIVLEYTYILVKPGTLDPTHGSPGSTKMVFPMAGLGGQIGLDRYDVNGDDIPETLSFDDIHLTSPTVVPTAQGVINVSAKPTTIAGMKCEVGDSVQFFDYMATVNSISGNSVAVAISYIGNRDLDYLGEVVLVYGEPTKDSVSVGRYATPPYMVNRAPVPVRIPFWLTLDSVGADYATLTPHRILKTGETFFVDCVEYDVAAIYIVPDDDDERDEIKYITLRNPLPKWKEGADERLEIPKLTVWKCRIHPEQSLPMLPPFSYTHDMIDDINIPDCVQGDPNDVVYPDEQLPDNQIDELDLYECFTGAGSPDGYGDVSGIDMDYNTIKDRWIEDVGALDGELLIYWLHEDKEERFDTNLLEEKFTEEDEEWEWKNIETLPWDYTEFVLPKLPDITDTVNNADGDYILVSSFNTTENDVKYRMKFVHDAKVGMVNSADIYINDADYNSQYRGINENSIRVYGRCNSSAEFPYDDYQGPFSIQSDENPSKDFVVFNPAFMYHGDPNAHDLFGMYFMSAIKADGDASEKVHLRMWYVPKLLEPVGETYPYLEDGEKVSNWDDIGMGDIVLEYTYILVEPGTLDPTHGSPGSTKMVFPMAGLGGQIGLDRYDVNGDDIPETLSFDAIRSTTVPTTQGVIDVSAEATTLARMNCDVGDSVQFFDYMATVYSISGNSVTVGLSYIGNRYLDYLGEVTLVYGDPTNDSVSVGHYATPTFVVNRAPVPVRIPFWLTLDSVGADNATLTPHRILQTGETFFVDCVEYDIAAIYIVQDDDDVDELDELKYITLRNPLPKWKEGADEKLEIPQLTVWKCRIHAEESLPMLPPFSYTHDMIDDINIPECLQGDPNDVVYPDEPLPDNQIDELDLYECRTGAGSPDGYGDVSGIDMDYNTIAERWIEDVGALDDMLLIYWIDEDKEERFDTNLLEEKFTEYDAEWEWKNIETLPWDYTEFVLPALPDITDPVNNDDGDYTLVSSFITENDVRMKFVYDAADGTGIYVNGGVKLRLMEGDTNLDNCVSLKDSTLIKLYLVDKKPLNEDQKKCADTKDDGVVDLKDSTFIKQWLVDDTTPLWESPADDDMLPPVPCQQ